MVERFTARMHVLVGARCLGKFVWYPICGDQGRVTSVSFRRGSIRGLVCGVKCNDCRRAGFSQHFGLVRNTVWIPIGVVRFGIGHVLAVFVRGPGVQCNFAWRHVSRLQAVRAETMVERFTARRHVACRDGTCGDGSVQAILLGS